MSTRGKYCSAAWCSNFQGCIPLSFFHFPRDTERCAQWLRFTLREDLLSKTPHDVRNLVLCSEHFKESDFKTKYPRKLLFPFACPSITSIGLNSRCFTVSNANVIPLQLSSSEGQPDDDSRAVCVGVTAQVETVPCNIQQDDYLFSNTIWVKQEPEDNADLPVWNIAEGGEPCSLKKEMKEEDDEEEEVKPPLTVFLYPSEVDYKMVKEEQEDPLSMSTENLNDKSAWYIGGECDPGETFIDSKTEIFNNVIRKPLYSKVINLPLSETGVEQKEYAPCNKNSTESATCNKLSAETATCNSHPTVNSACNIESEESTTCNQDSAESANCKKQSAGSASHSLKPCNATHVDEHSLCVMSVPESECEIMTMAKTKTLHCCSQCQQSFKSRSDLVKHMQVHTNECSIYQKKFVKERNLVEHMLIHRDERPQECSVCRKCFGRKSSLVEHLRIHSGERPYECLVCHKTFVQKPNLTKHNHIHSGESPHECSICQMKFVKKEYLLQHLRIHSGERRY